MDTSAGAGQNRTGVLQSTVGERGTNEETCGSLAQEECQAEP